MTDCPHCGKAVFKLRGDTALARTSAVVLHKSGEVEINCTHCKKGIFLPLVADQGDKELRKAAPRVKHTIRRT